MYVPGRDAPGSSLFGRSEGYKFNIGKALAGATKLASSAMKMMPGAGGGDAGGGGGGDAGGGGGAPGGAGGGGTATGAPSINKITVLVGNTGADVADGQPSATNNTQSAGGGQDDSGGSGGKRPCWCANNPKDPKNRKHLRTCRRTATCKKYSRAGRRGGGKSKYSEEYSGDGVQMQPYLEKSDFPLLAFAAVAAGVAILLE